MLRCVVYGCSNTVEDKVSLHTFPSEKGTRFKWITFVQMTRKHWKCGKSPHICSAHFKDSDFVNYRQFMEKLAYKLKLKSGAIPSIYPRKGTSNGEGNETPSTSRAGYRKREVRRIIKEYDDKLKNMEPESMELEPEVNAVPVSVEPVSIGIQCNIEDLHSFKDQATQVSRDTKEIAIQSVVNMVDCKTGPSKRLLCGDKDTRIDEVIEEDTEMVDDLKKDPSYIPEKDQQKDEEDMDMKSVAPADEVKYIVCKSKLWDILKYCLKCGKVCLLEVINEMGTYIKTRKTCPSCEESSDWESQSFIKSIPTVNIQLSASILFSGSSPAKVLRILKLMNVAAISRSTYETHQTKYLQPTIMTHWTAQQYGIFDTLRTLEDGLILGGDGRCDSPGHCAKYGAYTMMELRMNKIIDVQLVQSNEVGNSARMEAEGFNRSIELIESEGLQIDEFIGDRHPQINKLANELIEAKRLKKKYHDCWHVVKGNTKKITAIGKFADCKDVMQWQRSISNHMYWVATSSDGNGELAVAKWKSLLNHIQNIHEGHDDPLFPKCLHPPLTERKKKWLKKGSKIMTKLEDVLLNKRLIKDIANLSPKYQTSSLEGYHSLVLKFAPKNQSYSFKGMLTRTLLAAIHYNHNSDREELCDDDGIALLKIYYPKAKKGAYSVQPQKEETSYSYVTELMDLLFREVVLNPEPFQVHINNINIPPPLAAQYYHPSKEEAASSYTSRFKKK